MAEAQDDRVTICTNGFGVSAEVSVIFARSDRGEVYLIWVHLHERRRIFIGSLPCELSREWHVPSAVIHDNVWLRSGCCRNVRHPFVRIGDAVRKHPKIRTRRGGKVNRQWTVVGVCGFVVDKDACGDGSDSENRYRSRETPPRLPFPSSALRPHRLAHPAVRARLRREPSTFPARLMLLPPLAGRASRRL